MSEITHLKSTTHLDEILNKSPSKLTVIDFHAVWCGPCKVISPYFDSLAKENRDVNFLKCDVDQVSDVAQRYSVRAMPTFVFLKGQQKVDQVMGADKSGLAAAVKKHASPTAFGGQGQTLGGPSSSTNSSYRNPVGGQGGVSQTFAGLDPQLQVFLGLIGAYVLFWWLS